MLILSLRILILRRVIIFIRNWYVVDHNLWFKNHENNRYPGIIGPSNTIKGRIQMGHPEVNEQSGDDSSGSSPSVSRLERAEACLASFLF